MQADNGKRLVIDLTRLDPEGERLEGEIDIIDCEEEFVHPFGGVRYSLFVQPLGREVLVKGRFEQDFELVCSRCGEDFDDTVKVEDFTESYEIDEKTAEIDLTDDVRDDILLNLSSYPVCSETCPGVEQKTARPSDDRWNALDNLQLSKKKE